MEKDVSTKRGFGSSVPLIFHLLNRDDRAIRAQGQRHEGTRLPLLGIPTELRHIPAEVCEISSAVSPLRSS